MAAATKIRLTESKHLGDKKRFLMANSTQVWAGTMVMLNSAGLATPAAAAAANLGVKGVAVASKLSGTGGADYVLLQEGVFKLAGTTLAQASVGTLVYAEDDQTVDETQGANEPTAGTLVELVSATEGWVFITWKTPIQ